MNPRRQQILDCIDLLEDGLESLAETLPAESKTYEFYAAGTLTALEDLRKQLAELDCAEVQS